MVSKSPYFWKHPYTLPVHPLISPHWKLYSHTPKQIWSRFKKIRSLKLTVCTWIDAIFEGKVIFNPHFSGATLVFRGVIIMKHYLVGGFNDNDCGSPTIIPIHRNPSQMHRCALRSRHWCLPSKFPLPFLTDADRKCPEGVIVKGNNCGMQLWFETPNYW